MAGLQWLLAINASQCDCAHRLLHAHYGDCAEAILMAEPFLLMALDVRVCFACRLWFCLATILHHPFGRNVSIWPVTANASDLYTYPDQCRINPGFSESRISIGLQLLLYILKVRIRSQWIRICERQPRFLYKPGAFAVTVNEWVIEWISEHQMHAIQCLHRSTITNNTNTNTWC